MSLPHSPPEPAGLVLPQQNGTAGAPALKQALLALLASEARPIIDAGQVETLGQATLQLLLAAKAQQSDLAIAPASAAFVARVEACALSGALGLDQDRE